jgi:methylmalonyl-CoA mutase cobalamin-binding subunit
MPPPPESPVQRHPIAVAAERTRLSQDVLRVWERRYRAVEPTRGPGGQRLYSDADIARLRLLHAMTEAGRSISQVAGLPTPALMKLADEDARARTAQPAAASLAADLFAPAIAFTRALDSEGLESELRRAAWAYGATVFLDAIATPLMRRMGDEWEAGQLSLAQEHLMSATLPAVIADVARSAGRAATGPLLLMATPAGERHAIGALLAGAAASAEGWRVTYLGPDLPAAEIANAALKTGARAVGLSAIYVETPAPTVAEFRTLRSKLPADVPLLAGGAGAVVLSAELTRAGARVLADLADLRSMLRALRRAGES